MSGWVDYLQSREFAYLFLYWAEWVIRVVMLLTVPRRRSPNSALAWLTLIFFLPWVGLVLYVLVGTNRLPRRRVERYRQLLEEFNRRLGQRLCGTAVTNPDLPAEAMTAVRLAERLGQLPILGGNEVELLTDTNEVIDRLIADIEQAENHVHMLFYIFHDDETSHRVSEALLGAARRGVTCRVLADAVGSWAMLRRLAPKLLAGGVQVQAALGVGLFRRTVARIDVRNHRKIVVIDGRIGYTGSQNIINADYGRRGLAWHDMTARVRGPAVLALQAVFLGDWYFETEQILDDPAFFPKVDICGSVPVQVLPSGPTYPVENYHRMVIAALHTARHQVIITTPYFVPDQSFLQAVQIAVLRGVDVILIVPEKCDKILVGAVAWSYFGELLELGCQVYLYRPGLLHAKTMTIDNSFAFLGTGNFDIRSFNLNFEVNLLLYGDRVTAELRRRQLDYLAYSRSLTYEEWSSRPKIVKTFQGIARLISPLL
jgi:cardiolipin synthase